MNQEVLKIKSHFCLKVTLTLSRRRQLSCRNQSNDLHSKSIDWFLYDNGPRHERVIRRLNIPKGEFETNIENRNKNNTVTYHT